MGLNQDPTHVAKSKSNAAGRSRATSSEAFREDLAVGMITSASLENETELIDPVDEGMGSGLITGPDASGHPANGLSIRMDRAPVVTMDPLDDAIDPLLLPERLTMTEVAAALAQRPAAHPGALSLFAAAGAHAGTTKGLGYQVGLGAGWQVLPRLSLRSSVERHWTDLDASLPGSAQDRELANADSPIVADPLGEGTVVIPVGNLFNTASAADLGPLVSTVRHWRWNLGAHYRIAPWLAAEFGGGLDWGIRAYTRYPIISGTGTSQDIREGTSLLNDYGLVRSSTVNAYGGIALTPVRWLELFGRYTHPFGAYLDVSGTGISSEKKGRTDKLGSIQLGVRVMIRP